MDSKPPDNWRELSHEEQRAWIERDLQRLRDAAAQADYEEMGADDDGGPTVPTETPLAEGVLRSFEAWTREMQRIGAKTTGLSDFLAGYSQGVHDALGDVNSGRARKKTADPSNPLWGEQHKDS